ncbi:DUF4145 domain-containing protein [Microbulbifer variabilis]|uniref:DUF4145 domain-containing protein n=1 Tax=Microbulbifer variabilis TaxID=266805 RepID=UPI0003817504|nr:DUF4145 domain-containing protein [Microbulbifer variabilis]
MGTITRDCPHCHSANSTFNTFGEFSDPNTNTPKVYTVALRCGGCHEGYIIRAEQLGGQSPCRISGNLETSKYLKVIREYPEAITAEYPKYLPDNIEKFYIQAADSLKAGSYDASAIMSRKVLEVSVKKLQPDGKGSLYQRIERLYEIGKITDDLKSWAHIIRGDGNDAAHEEDPVTNLFAEQLLDFTEMFLMYTFTMPGMVSTKKISISEGV